MESSEIVTMVKIKLKAEGVVEGRCPISPSSKMPVYPGFSVQIISLNDGVRIWADTGGEIRKVEIPVESEGDFDDMIEIVNSCARQYRKMVFEESNRVIEQLNLIIGVVAIEST